MLFGVGIPEKIWH